LYAPQPAAAPSGAGRLQTYGEFMLPRSGRGF